MNIRKTIKDALQAIIQTPYGAGVVDGWNQPTDLARGMTYPEDFMNEAYDEGANLGQRMRNLISLRGWKADWQLPD